MDSTNGGKTMNSYERVERVLNGEIPDRVPTFELMIDPGDHGE